MKLIDIIVGARPNFMKAASIIQAFSSYKNSAKKLKYRLVHTGQHYDNLMSKSFFEQLDIPLPDVNLNVGSGTQAEQTSAIMTSYEKLLLKSPSDMCLVVGDVNSTMACAIVARKMEISLAHVEAGIRSFDWSMPEEINRVVTDSITNWFFTTSETANLNLKKQGVACDKIFFVGNTMIDTLYRNMKRLRKPQFLQSLNIKEKDYLLVTLHRPSNVDIIERFKTIIRQINKYSRNFPVIFPVHPRVLRVIENINMPTNFFLVEPQPYLEFNYLAKHAKVVITDSGGVTEETTVMGTPCITLRDTTERPETVNIGTNELVGSNPNALSIYLNKVFCGKWKNGSIPKLWDGRSGERILKILHKLI